ncbi:MAG: hypothetical protein LBT38_07920 [Deltaproteobacteria bacterium]|jgi:hypothetical protein|nr:hypothetical protein [Deltaproteobacteria bacterium]
MLFSFILHKNNYNLINVILIALFTVFGVILSESLTLALSEEQLKELRKDDYFLKAEYHFFETVSNYPLKYKDALKTLIKEHNNTSDTIINKFMAEQGLTFTQAGTMFYIKMNNDVINFLPAEMRSNLKILDFTKFFNNQKENPQKNATLKGNDQSEVPKNTPKHDSSIPNISSNNLNDKPDKLPRNLDSSNKPQSILNISNIKIIWFILIVISLSTFFLLRRYNPIKGMFMFK